MALQDLWLYIEDWLPVFVAILSIFLAWLCVRLLNKEDEEDEQFTETIKSTLNPDKVHNQESDLEKDSDIKEDENLEPNLPNKTLDSEDQMSEKELENERRVQEEQLQHIFEVMEEDKDKYGTISICDVKEQLKLYKTE